MSRALETLVRLQKGHIDEAKRAVAEIVARQDALTARIAGLDAELIAEQRDAQRDNAGAAAYGPYARRVALTRQAHADERIALAREETEARDRLADAYVELKKIEHLLSMQAEQERLAENAMELAAIDEAVSMRAARKG